LVKHFTPECNVQHVIKSATDVRKRGTWDTDVRKRRRKKELCRSKAVPKGTRKFQENSEGLIGAVTADSEAMDAILILG